MMIGARKSRSDAVAKGSEWGFDNLFLCMKK